MRIVSIGAGRLATQLCKALIKSGHSVVQVYSKTIENAKMLAEELQSEATNNIIDIVTDADAYILAVKDSALEELIGELARKGNSNAVYMHTAGSMPMSLFEGRVINYGVLYPMQTFSKDKSVDFSVIPVFIEANNEKAHEVISTLANSVSDSVKYLSSDARKKLHLAAVFACNFSNHCYALAAEILAKEGVEFDVMLPLIEETTSKLHNIEPKDAQTGPAVRYDVNVISKHLEMLNDNQMAKDIYELMSKSIYNMYKA